MAAEVIGSRREATPLELRSQAWHTFAGRLNERLDELADVDAWGLYPAELAETIVELHQAEAKLAASKARLLARAEQIDLASSVDATSTAAWLRSEVPVTLRQAKDAVALGTALESLNYPGTAAAMASGELQADQALVIVNALDKIQDLVNGDDRARGEAHLVELAKSYDARQLRLLGRHLLEVLDPELADRELAKQLEAEEEAAARAASFTMIDDGRGKAHGRFTIPSLQGQMLRTLLQGFANPAVPDAIPRTDDHGGGDAADGEHETPRPARRRLTSDVLGDALVRLIEAYPVDRVPTSGGLNATVVVTMSLETLQDGLRRATVVGTDVCVSGAAARRMACAAGLIPAVLDGKSRVLDVGRKRRFATPAQRLAKLVEQSGLCAVESCDRPASWGDAHHWKKRWVDGGTTNLDDLVMVCPRHHTLAHLPGRTMQPAGGGRYRIRRRT